jgi:hypothetical protein
MKKTMLLLVAAGLVFAFGVTASAQDQTPPPVKPARATTVPKPAVPPAQTVPTPAPAKALPAAPPVAVAPESPATVAAMIETAPGVAMLVEQTPPPKEAVAAAPPEQIIPQPEPSAQAETAPRAKPRPAQEMRTELIKVKYADGGSIYGLLRAYKSRDGNVTPTSMVSQGNQESTFVVTDTPEIVENLTSLVRDRDVTPAEFQFTVQLVQGTEAEGSGDEALRNDPVIRELRSVLRYKTFSLLDGTLVRVIDGNDTQTKFGPNGEYVIRLRPKYVKDGSSETLQTVIQLRKPKWISQKTTNTEKKEETQSMQMYYDELIQTVLQLKVGEKTVVGVSKSDSDRGLILILSAKVVK